MKSRKQFCFLSSAFSLSPIRTLILFVSLFIQLQLLRTQRTQPPRLLSLFNMKFIVKMWKQWDARHWPLAFVSCVWILYIYSCTLSTRCSWRLSNMPAAIQSIKVCELCESWRFVHIKMRQSLSAVASQTKSYAPSSRLCASGRGTTKAKSSERWKRNYVWFSKTSYGWMSFAIARNTPHMTRVCALCDAPS